uniref:ribonuclease H n=1 Tax=Oryzias latipes TaxID=8090 RepID=A0A3P9JTB0_ORYLA
MDGLKPPAQWSMDAANLPKAWKTWKEEFTLYTELALPDTEEKAGVKLFYYLIGERGRELCGTLIGAESRVTVSGLMAKIDEHCNPKVNETVERYRFFARNQALGENIDKYVTDLRMLASTCNFGQLRDSLIRDRIVCGTSSSSWRERLLREENLTLDKCLDICRAMEISREYNKTITGQTLEELHVVRQKERKSQEKGISCRYCGRTHERIKSKCPAYGKNCKKCGRENHFAITCRSKTVRKENTPREKRKTVHTVTEQDSDSGKDILTVTAITQTAEEVNQFDEGVGKKKEQLFAGMMIDNSLVQFQIDCGATCNVIPINLLNPNVKMEHTDKVLVMYNKSKLCPLGKCKVKMVNPKNNKKYKVEFQVVGEDCKTLLLGRSASEAMKLIQVKYDNIYALDRSVTKAPAEENTWLLEAIKTEFQDVFTGDGCLKGEYELEIDPTVQPVKLPKRRVPVSMMKPLKEELKSLEDRRIITPVEHSTEWISGMVTVQKPNGRPRICIDPRPLNKALKRSHFPLPTIDDILPDVSKAKVFTVCDVKHGFWHVKLTEESSQLTTFATPFGRFRWLRMPIGISPAPEVFQRRLMQALENLPGTYVIADDILITGKGDTTEEAEKDHDRNLRLFLERCREKNIKLNAEKLKLRRREVPYIGHLLTADGLRADPEKVRAITEMPAPTDIKGVQRLVGMINYLAKFYKHLSDDCEPLRQLTHKDSLWEWSDVQEDAFKRLKEKITQVPVLKYYSPEEELTLQCDASETGLGAALTQKGRDMLLADTLSRAYLQESNNKSQTELETECVNMVEYVPVSTESMEKIRTGTKTDHKLQILIETIQKGWPACKKEVPTEITQFQSMQDELSTQDGLVFKGERDFNGTLNIRHHHLVTLRAMERQSLQSKQQKDS